MTQFPQDDEEFPDSKVVNISGVRIGLCHGHDIIPWGDIDALSVMQRKVSVNVLICRIALLVLCAGWTARRLLLLLSIGSWIVISLCRATRTRAASWKRTGAF